MPAFTHIDEKGNVNMVDVGQKPNQLRIARALGKIILATETIELIREDQMKKGDVLTVAEIAGIQAAKRTSELIPLCHPLQITHIEVRIKLKTDGVEVESEVRCLGKTGVEMEALTSVSVALLTVYDMCKAVDKNMSIEKIVLLRKTKTAVEKDD